MRFGSQTVTFVTVTENPAVRDRYNNPEIIRAEIDVPGCLFRPMNAKEKTDLGDIVTDPWKCTAPPVATVLNAEANGEVKADGVTYKIIGGPRPYPDLSGRPFKVTVICQRMEV